MTRLVDANALFENLDGMMAVSPTGYIHGDTVADMISDAPTVDAVPVVRCKDCTHVLPQGMYGDWYMCEMWDKQIHTSLSGYCNKAKRKEE